MTSVSLIGWTSDGTPRLSKDNLITTKVHIGNNKQKFIIGGLRKREVVRSTTGVPILSRLPFIGYLFSTEKESTKRSQIILVCEAEPSYPDSQMPADMSRDIHKSDLKFRRVGDKNDYFFNQWIIDKEFNSYKDEPKTQNKKINKEISKKSDKQKKIENKTIRVNV
jgi:Flp pilus assembly secretin CpaC